MKLEKDVLDFPADARVWVYMSDRPISTEEQGELQERIDTFTREWTSHSYQLRATGWIEQNRFLILMVDQSQAGASGCSIDKSVAFLVRLGGEKNIEWFNRLNFAYVDGDGSVSTIHKDGLKAALESGAIRQDTQFFNTLVQSRDELLNQWLSPLEKSWHRNFI